MPDHHTLAFASRLKIQKTTYRRLDSNDRLLAIELIAEIPQKVFYRNKIEALVQY
jgi:hypothetical protein